MLLRLSAKLLDLTAAGIAPGVIGDPTALAQGRMIFLAPFMAHWKRGPLRDDLMRWAPHIFNANGEPR